MVNTMEPSVANEKVTEGVKGRQWDRKGVHSDGKTIWNRSCKEPTAFRERDRESERETDRQTDRQRQRE